jgi:sugar phosphate permease
MGTDKLLVHWQRKMMLLCWVAYVCAYLVRTNLSVALPGMMSEFHWSNATAGLIGSVFFWCYAVGQLINGFVGDKFNSRSLVFIGLAAAGILNVAVGLSSSYIAIIIFWGINGFFLSALWGPIVRTTAVWFETKKRTAVAVILSLSMIGGYIISWGLIGQLAGMFSWRVMFIFPAAVALIFSCLWLWLARSNPHQVGLEVPDDSEDAAPSQPEHIEQKSTKELFIENKFWFLAMSCFALGFVKEGIMLWSPTFLQQTQGLSTSESSAFSLAIPVIGTAGILLSGWLNKFLHDQDKKTVAILFAGAVLSSLFLAVFNHGIISLVVIMLGLTVAFMYGANTILLTIVPYSFAKYGKVSTVAGSLDFCSYIGAACTGVITGAVIDKAGWSSALILWAALSVVAVISILLSKNRASDKHGAAKVNA